MDRELETRSEGDMQTDFERLTQELFGFLITEKGFRRGRTERSGLSTTYNYKHVTAGVGVGVDLDFRDGTIDLYLLKLDDGKLPEFGGFGGRRRDVPLFLRDNLHIHGKQLDALFALYRSTQPRNYQYYADLLRAMRDVVAQHIDLLLQQPLDVLFPLAGRRRNGAGEAKGQE